MKLAKRIESTAIDNGVEWALDVDSSDDESVAARFAELPVPERHKLAAFLAGILQIRDIAKLAGKSKQWVEKSIRKHKDIALASRIARLESIRNAAQKKALIAINSINIDNVPDDKKSRVAKELMEAGDIADVSARLEKAQDIVEDTSELIWRIRSSKITVKKKMTADIEKAKVIDVE